MTIHVLSAALLLALAAALLLAVGVNLIGDRNPAPAPTTNDDAVRKAA